MFCWFLPSTRISHNCIYTYICLPVCSDTSVVTNSWQIYGPHPSRLFCPLDSQGKNTGVGCHFLLQYITHIYPISIYLYTCPYWASFPLPSFLLSPRRGIAGLHEGQNHWLKVTRCLRSENEVNLRGQRREEVCEQATPKALSTCTRSELPPASNSTASSFTHGRVVLSTA